MTGIDIRSGQSMRKWARSGYQDVSFELFLLILTCIRVSHICMPLLVCKLLVYKVWKRVLDA